MAHSLTQARQAVGISNGENGRGVCPGERSMSMSMSHVDGDAARGHEQGSWIDSGSFIN